MAQHPSGNALHANFDVDYVISYRFTDVGMFLTRIRSGPVNGAMLNLPKVIPKHKQTSRSLPERWDK